MRFSSYTFSGRKGVSGCIAAHFAGLLLPSLLLLSLPARAGDYGTCPAADLVETDLKQSNVSGYYIPGLRLIILNRLILQQYAAPVGRFILAHECSHTEPEIGDDENAADCAAAMRGTKEGWLGNPEIVQVCVHLSRLISDGLHPLPAFRCGNIRRCAAMAKQKPGEAQQSNSQSQRDITPLTSKRAALAKGRGTIRCTMMPDDPDCRTD